jgi:hypothetical protein
VVAAAALMLCPAVAAAGARAATPAPDPGVVLAVRAAQVDAIERLADMVLAARLSAEKTVGDAVGPAGDGEIAIRVLLRSARMAAEPRVYSDGLAEVDLEIPLDSVVRQVRALGILGQTKTAGMPDLEHRAMDGYLRASGAGRAPADLPAEVIKRAEAARPEDLPEMFPLGWERVTPAGRVAAVRDARVRAYQAMAALIRDIHLGQTDKVGDLIGRVGPESTVFDSFIRALPVTGEPRLMPDRIAEETVTVPVRDLIRVLKDIRALRLGEARWSAEDIDQLSVRLKVERLTATGRGMPPPEESVPAQTPTAAGEAPMPEWAGQVLEARGTARFSDEVVSREDARVLAARSAKVRALSDIEKQIGAVKLDDGSTVRQRAAKDEVFRRDLKAFLSSAKTAAYRPTEDGKGWAVVLRLSLVRLYEVSRPRQ